MKIKPQVLYYFFLILAVSACVETQSSNVNNSITVSIDISESNSTTELDESNKFNLKISGINNTITINSNNNIEDFEILGDSNIVYIESNTTINSFKVKGINNIIYVPLNSGLSFVDTGSENNLKSLVTSSILGTWSHAYTSNNCVETYLFNSNGTFSGASKNEVFSGTYNFGEWASSDGKHSLNVAFTADNGLEGCLGSSTNDTGKKASIDVSFSEKGLMNWHSENISGDISSFIKKDFSIELSAPLASLEFGLKQFKFSWGKVEGTTFYKLFENKDRLSGYSEVWSGTKESYNHVVPLFDRYSASYIVSACNNHECNYSDEIYISGALISSIGYVKAADSNSWDNFGKTVVLSNDGKKLLVTASSAKKAYVFSEANGLWAEEVKLTPPSSENNDWSGMTASLSGNGDLIAIHANGEIFTYQHSLSGWLYQDTIILPSSTTSHWRELIYLSNDGSTLAIGAEGTAYIYSRVNSNWVSQKILQGKGYYLGLSGNGNTIVTSEISGSSINIYIREDSKWAFNESISVAVDDYTVFAFNDLGTTLAIGLSNESSDSQGINGDESNKNAPKSGAVFAYVKGSEKWEKQSYIKANNSGAYDRFGLSISLNSDGNILVVGAYGEDSSSKGLNGEQNNNSGNVNSDGGSSGSAYVFNRKNGVWNQQMFLKPTNTENYEEYGRSVSISGNGKTIAIGNDYEASSSTGIGGDDSDNSAYASGAVFLY